MTPQIEKLKAQIEKTEARIAELQDRLESLKTNLQVQENEEIIRLVREEAKGGLSLQDVMAKLQAFSSTNENPFD